jgi:hypothetical protein
MVTVLTYQNTSTLNLAVFWFVAPRSPVEVCRPFRGAFSLLAMAVMMEAATSSETAVNFYQTTRCQNPEDSHLPTRHNENLGSHYIYVLYLLLSGIRRIEC